MSGFAVRDATPRDGAFIADMLVEAANWSGLLSLTRAEVLSGMQRRYIAGWPRPSDAGVIAVDDLGSAIGAAWYRVLPRSEPGFGFVATGVPELVIGVRAPWRSRGVGRALLTALMANAGRAGHARITLSVQRGNHAATLYRDLGFREVDSSPERVTMVRRLH
jgi:GNAT superfamily N-acetyltransferase